MHTFSTSRVGALIAGIVAGVLYAETMNAQVVAYAGGGALVPTGEYGDFAKTGWMGVLGVGIPVGLRRAYAGVEVMYGSNAHKNLAGDKTDLPGVLAWVEYRFGDDSRPGPYLLGLAGTVNHQFKSRQFPDLEENAWKAAFGIGAGLDIPVRGNSFFVEARFMSRDGTTFAPLLAGVSVPIGARK